MAENFADELEKAIQSIFQINQASRDFGYENIVDNKTYILEQNNNSNNEKLTDGINRIPSPMNVNTSKDFFTGSSILGGETTHFPTYAKSSIIEGEIRPHLNARKNNDDFIRGDRLLRELEKTPPDVESHPTAHFEERSITKGETGNAESKRGNYLGGDRLFREKESSIPWGERRLFQFGESSRVIGEIHPFPDFKEKNISQGENMIRDKFFAGDSSKNCENTITKQDSGSENNTHRAKFLFTEKSGENTLQSVVDNKKEDAFEGFNKEDWDDFEHADLITFLSPSNSPPPPSSNKALTFPKLNLTKNKKVHKNSPSREFKSDVKGFSCQICNKIFKSIYHLQQHKIIHKTESKKYACSQCPKKHYFTYRRNLRRHERNLFLKKAKSNLPPPPPKANFCEKCAFFHSEKESCLFLDIDKGCFIPEIEEKILCESCGNFSKKEKGCEVCLLNRDKGKKEFVQTHLCCRCGVIYKSSSVEGDYCERCSNDREHIPIQIGHGDKKIKIKRKHSPTRSILCEKCGKMNESESTQKKDCNKCSCNAPKKRKVSALYKCHRCETICKDRKEMYEHDMQNHQNSTNLQKPIWETEERSPPWINERGNEDTNLKEVYTLHNSLILKNHKRGVISNVYNFSVDNQLMIKDMLRQIEYIYLQEKEVFKINLAFGYILQNVENDQYRYFKAYENQNVLTKPISISRKSDILNFQQELKQLDIIDHILKQRESTKYKPVLLTNVVYTTFSTNFAIGADVVLPNYIKQNRNIIGMEKNSASRKYKKQNLCMFRCITAHFHLELFKKRNICEIENRTMNYVQQWFAFRNEIYNEDEFEGIVLGDMYKIEECFKININIFSLREDLTCECVRKSLSRFNNTMNLNLFDNHVSYIIDINSYCKKFECMTCNKHFERKDRWKEHIGVCEKKLSVKHPGGFYKQNESIFEKLESYGIYIPQEYRCFKDFIVFDMEAMLQPVYESNSEKLTWTHQHIPISVAVCSNFPNFDKPYCIVNSNGGELIKEMVQYLKEIGEEIKKNNFKKFANAFNQLETIIANWDISDEDSTDISSKIMHNQLTQLKTKFELYCSQIPVIGFNSARYDLNLIKSMIIKSLDLANAKPNFIIKKNNSYSCITTPDFIFLDITNFLSPGTSYSKFLKAFEVEECKGFFPYEYLTDENKLKETSLPALGVAWWSNLKEKNILDDGIKSIEENYRWLEDIWEKENMQNLEDFLKWYNCLDVGPFVKGVKRLCEFYFQKGIDIFKEAISVPGIARKMIFQEAKKVGATFALIDGKNKDLYEKIENNIVGGPSIIFTRRHKAGETYIRNSNNICQKIIGFDANALYLWCIGEDMPVGYFIRRRKEMDFKPEKNVRYSSMFHWMDWINFSEGKEIKHYRNNGKEKRIGPYLVDGFEEKSNTVYQFQGCYFHGHECYLTKHIKDENQRKLLEKRKIKTSECRKFLIKQNYTVREIYECEFKTLCCENINLQKFIFGQQPTFYQKKPRKVNESEIIQGVLNEELFGMVEVDISVPSSWDEVDYIPKTNLNPQEYFSEMSPFFGNVDVSFDEIGKHMQEHIIKNNLGQKNRRLLIGAMKGKEMLIATPLLKWYIQHGVKIEYIHQVVEYKRSACFQNFVQEISNARRLGDVDETKSVISDTMKLIGNSAFGSMIMDKKKHKKIYYVEGYEEASNAVNNDKFESLTEIAEGYFEIQAFKDKIELNLPTQIGYFILQLAKMRMLEFYYDFMDYYVEREYFEYCEMDTDSAYMAIASKSFEEIIKPELRDKYNRCLNSFCGEEKFNADNDMHWFPRSCCKKHSQFDKRTPGLFKKEYEGEEMIGLCSKTYIVSNNDGYKFSSKGVNKARVQDPLTIFRHVLETKSKGSGDNIGFRARNNSVYTYTQTRDGFSYLYCKRKVLEDGNKTVPLNITIHPSKKPKISEMDSD